VEYPQTPCRFFSIQYIITVCVLIETSTITHFFFVDDETSKMCVVLVGSVGEEKRYALVDGIRRFVSLLSVTIWKEVPDFILVDILYPVHPLLLLNLQSALMIRSQATIPLSGIFYQVAVN